MKLTKNKILLAVGAIFFVVIGFRIAASIKKKRLVNNTTEQVLVVRAQKVTKGAVVDQVRISGTIRPANEVEIFPKIAGRIIAINHDVGDFVKAGDVLAVIEHNEVLLQEKSAMAAKAVAQANEASSKRELERAKKLFLENALSKTQFEGAELRYELARAERENAEAQAAIARQMYKNSNITSLINGTITKKIPTLGTMVSPTSAVFTVQDISKLKLSTSVEASVLSRLKKGSEANLSLEGLLAPTKSFLGTISMLSPSLDQHTRRAAIEIEINAPYEGLLPNMFVDGFLVLYKSENKLTIPNNSIHGVGQDLKVYKIAEQKVSVISPRLGSRDEHNTEVISGLHEGDLVATSGLESLREGIVVTIE